MIEIKDEKIIINGKEELLFGGELHYFRVPKREWRNRIKQIKAAGGNLVSTYVPWIFHEKEEGEIDLTGQTRPEKDLQTFLQIIKEENMYCLVRPGPYVMAELVNHGLPKWLNDNYQEVIAKTQQGDNHRTGVVSYLHPVYLEKVNNWYQHVCKIVAPYQISNKGPVIMFQLDNEVGMLQWVTNQGDFNEVTLKNFEIYLKDKYTLNDFKATYNIDVETFEEFTQSKVGSVDESYGLALQNDYGLFMRQYYRSYIEYLKKSAIKNGISVPFVVNIHGFDTHDGILKRGTKYPIGVSQLLETAKIEDVIMAGDYYIGNIEYDNYIDIVLANAITKSIQTKNQPLFSAEFQGGNILDKPRLQPSTFDLTTRLCFANGMNAVNYYMFVSGENYENIGLWGRRHEWQAPLSITGEERSQYPVIQHLGKMFQSFSQQLSIARPVYNTYMAFYPDYYMTEFSNEHTKKVIQQIEVQRDLYWYNGVAKGLTIKNIAYDGVNLLDHGDLDVEKVPSLWVFATEWMDENVQSKLIRYLQNGGKLVLFPTIPTKTMKGVLCTVLKDFLGVKFGQLYGNGFITVEEVDEIPAQSIQTFENVEGAFAWNTFNETVAFEQTAGNGKVIVLGVGINLELSDQYEVVQKTANRLGVSSSVILDEGIEAISAFARKAPNGKNLFIFLNNFDEYGKETSVTYQGQTLFDGNKVRIPGKSGLMLPIQVNIAKDIFIEYGTGEIFECRVCDQEVMLNVRIRQNEEVFRFISHDFVPQAAENISVRSISVDTYEVSIHSPNENEVISFQHK